MLSTRQTVQTFLLSELFQADKYLDITFFLDFWILLLRIVFNHLTMQL
jgi:hypothetical protein